MTSVITWFKKNIPLLKGLFLLSVLVIVVGQLANIGKSLQPQQITAVFSEIAWWKLLLMLLIGLTAVTPMLGYDVILNTLLEQKLKKRYLIETSWLINTINNIAGFGGMISIGLRSEFYGKNQPKKIFQALSKIMLFLMSGLSVYSLFSCLLLLFAADPIVQQYKFWLIGGSLYFPAVLLVTKFKKDGLLGGLTGKQRWLLILVSVLEWTGVAASFLLIGWLMGLHFSILHVLPLFIAASIIGIISMIPGELGSFDLMMIIGLSAIGIPRAEVVTWILLYRLFYYIIPFIIGALLFFKNLSSGLLQRYHGIPKELAQQLARKLLVFAMYFSGVMMVLLATIPNAFDQLKWLQDINPWRYHLLTQFPSLLLGFLLLIMGRGIANRVRRAYLPTLALLLLAIIYTFFSDFSIVPMLFLSLLLLMTLFSKKELDRHQLVYSWEAVTKDGLLFLSLIILYIAIGVYNAPHFPHHHRQLAFFLFPSEKAWFSGLLAILIVTLFIGLFLRYLQGSRHQIGSPLDEAAVLEILTKFGGNADSHLVFLGDKQLYYYHNGTENTVFFQMNTWNDKCVIMGDPAGDPADFPQAVEQLIHEADQWGYLPVFYEVSEKIVMLLHEFGYDFIKMGESAEVDLTTFTLSGKRMKGQRALFNKLTKNHYQFAVLEPPFSAAFLQELQGISDEWLGNRKEKGFSLGFFAASYLQKAGIAVVGDEAGTIVAFASLMPTYTETIASIDLMRHSPEKAPAGTMDFLFIQLFKYFSQQGFTAFDLGMAPLANVGTSRKSFLQERIAYLVYQFGSRFYSFQGLRDYKEKYTENWQPRYTAYSRDSWIIYVMSALLIIDNAPIKKAPFSVK